MTLNESRKNGGVNLSRPKNDEGEERGGGKSLLRKVVKAWAVKGLYMKGPP